MKYPSYVQIQISSSWLWLVQMTFKRMFGLQILLRDFVSEIDTLSQGGITLQNNGQVAPIYAETQGRPVAGFRAVRCTSDDRTNSQEHVNDVHKQLFAQNCRTIYALTPTRADLIQHAKISAYQAGYCLGQGLVAGTGRRLGQDVDPTSRLASLCNSEWNFRFVRQRRDEVLRPNEPRPV